MQIKFTNYKDGLHKFVFETDVEKLGIAEIFAGNILLNCEMDKSSTQIILNCDFQITAKQICDRCAVDFEELIEADFKSIYFLTSNRNNNEDESGIHYLSSEDDKIDLSDDTVENTLLALSMKTLCNDDCKGLCSICGINKNEKECNCVEDTINPVWEKLLKLKDLS